MIKKSTFAFIALSIIMPAIVVGTAIGISTNTNKAFRTKAADGPYSLTLNSSNTPEGLTSTFVDNFTTTVKTALGNDVELGMVHAKAVSGKYVNLGHRGMLYNFSSSNGEINGITSITTTFDNPLFIKTSSQPLTSGNGGGAMLEGLYQLTSGSTYTLSSPAKYFVLIAGDANVSITSLTINYACSDQGIGFDALIGSYTGQNGNLVYEMDFSRNNSEQEVVFKSLNKKENDSFDGQVVINGNNVICSFSSSTYTTQVQQDGRLLHFVSQIGSLPELDFYKVYEVEDFENYTAAGTGWDNNNKNSANATGLRAHWYCDYNAGGSNTSPIGGTGWSLMGSSDYLQFNSTKGRNGSKVAAFKGNSSTCRYFQMNAYTGVPAIIGRGSKLSFWAAGAYSDNGFSTKSGNNATVKAVAFYNTKITSANQGTYDSYEFSIPAQSDWTEYTVSLDANKNYYSIAFYCKTGGTYTPIDDIRIYTVTPYAEYQPSSYPEGTFKTTATAFGSTFDIVIAIGNYKNQLVEVMAANESFDATGIDYDDSTKKVTITTTGGYSSYKCGTITGTYNTTNDTLTNLTCSGDFKSYFNNKTASRLSYYYTCEGSTSELQSQFKRRYNSGSWNVDTGNADRLTKDTSHYVSGTSAVKLRGYTGGAVALNLNADISGGYSCKNIGFWVYNPSNNDLTLRVWVYKATSFGSNEELTGPTAKAHSWVYYQMGFTSKVIIYNFQLADFNNSGVYLTFDNIILF